MSLALNLHIDAATSDGVSAPLSLARFVNDNRLPGTVNCVFTKVPSRQKALLVALRAIEPGEELFASYGEKYWARAGGLPAAPALRSSSGAEEAGRAEQDGIKSSS